MDFFFILDGELTMYLIPSQVIAGRVGILLRNYASYVVGNAAFLMEARFRGWSARSLVGAR